MRFVPSVLTKILFFCLFGLLLCNLCDTTEQPAPHFQVDDKVRSDIADQYPTPVGISKDGSQILLKTNDWNVEKLSVIDRATRRVVSETESPNAHLAISWSASKNDIAYLSGDGNSDHYQLFLWTIKDKTAKAVGVPQTNTAIQSIRWNPDGSRLAYLVGNNNDAMVWTFDRRDPSHEGPLAHHVSPMSDFEWSPDGQLMAVVFRNNLSTLAILDSNTGSVVKTINVSIPRQTEIRDISWAPSGEKIVLSARTRGYFGLFEANLKTNGVLGCQSSNADILAPHFTGDDLTVIYSVSLDSQVTIRAGSCRKSSSSSLGFSSGTTRFLRLLTGRTDGSFPKGSLVVLHSALDEPPALYEISIDQGKQLLIYASPKSAQLKSAAPRVVTIPSADGVVIPTVLWRSERPSSSNVVVVDVHGGPHLQKYRRWEILPELLTSNGIDVLSPNYRTSEGYGYQFEQMNDFRSQVDDIIAVCKYAKSLHRGKTTVILMGTSYGSLLAANAAIQNSKDIDGLVLNSMIPEGFKLSPVPEFTLPLYCFHGQNDPQSPENTRAELQSLFGQNVFQNGQNHWRVFANEGHVFRLASSWAEVYSGVLKICSEAANRREAERWRKPTEGN
jgi:dipeptidyl aminopeptidase/acylaminoacyl peptidase